MWSGVGVDGLDCRDWILHYSQGFWPALRTMIHDNGGPDGTVGRVMSSKSAVKPRKCHVDSDKGKIAGDPGPVSYMIARDTRSWDIRMTQLVFFFLSLTTESRFLAADNANSVPCLLS